MTTGENKKLTARGLSFKKSLCLALLSQCLQLLLFYLFYDVTTLQPRYASALAWVCITFVCCIVLFFFIRKTSPVGLHSPILLFGAGSMIYLAAEQTAFFVMTNVYDVTDTVKYLIAACVFSFVFFFLYFYMMYFLLFHRGFHRYHRRHLLTMTAIVTAIVNYTVFYLTELLIFDIDYYMYADMLAWLVASLYFFLVTRDLVKNENGNASIVLYLMCLFSFLLTHMLLRFSYGFSYQRLPQIQREWIIHGGKPCLVVLTTLVLYLVVRYCFPHIKRIDDKYEIEQR